MTQEKRLEEPAEEGEQAFLLNIPRAHGFNLSCHPLGMQRVIRPLQKLLIGQRLGRMGRVAECRSLTARDGLGHQRLPAGCGRVTVSPDIREISNCSLRSLRVL